MEIRARPRQVLFFYKIVPAGCWGKDMYGSFAIYAGTLD